MSGQGHRITLSGLCRNVALPGLGQSVALLRLSQNVALPGLGQSVAFPELGQNVALHVSFTARNSIFHTSAFRVCSA